MDQSIQLPPPSNITRQTATGIQTPNSLVRSTSTASDRSEIRNPDESMRSRLSVYRTYLEHELEFVDNEIHALIERPPSQDPAQDHALAELRDGLKIRYNGLRVRLGKVKELLEVM
jgi:hypothetical protein